MKINTVPYCKIIKSKQILNIQMYNKETKTFMKQKQLWKMKEENLKKFVNKWKKKFKMKNNQK